MANSASFGEQEIARFKIKSLQLLAYHRVQPVQPRKSRRNAGFRVQCVLVVEHVLSGISWRT
jgi:hypothetical protein